VYSVDNTTAFFWQQGPNDLHGLTWGPTADGTTVWTNTVEGSSGNGPTAQLTDVVGSRTVIVQAVADVGGTTVTKQMTINFGPGPMTVFSGGVTNGSEWADYSSYAIFPTLPIANLGAPRLCGGLSWASNLTIVGSGVSNDVSYGADWVPIVFDSATWRHSPSSKLPTADQMLAVARYNSLYHPGVPRKGASQASGAPYPFTYVTGLIRYNQAGDFLSTFVDLDTGQTTTNPLTTYAVVACAN
jgi:hypothetical protein